eukprot:g1371.t1
MSVMRRSLPLDNFSLASAINACAFCAMWQNALSILALKPDPGVSCFNACLSVCGKGSRWQHALQLFDEMRERNMQQDTGPREGISFLDNMPSQKVAPDVFSFSTLMSVCEKTGHWELALSLLFAMPTKQVKPNNVSYNAAISACSKGTQWHRALHLLDAMMVSQLVPDTISANAAISACEEGTVFNIQRVSQRMCSLRLRRSVIGISSAISACEKGSSWAAALQLLRDMPTWRCVANDITYNSTMKAAERGGHWELVLALLEEMNASHVGVEPGPQFIGMRALEEMSIFTVSIT